MRKQKRKNKQGIGEGEDKNRNHQEQGLDASAQSPLPQEDSEQELFFAEKKFRKILGWLTVFFMIFMFVTEGTTTEEVGAVEVKNRVSSEITSGFTLSADSQFEIDARDFEVTGFDGHGTARMLIWDYRGDTNDEVQILVDGQVIREVHVLNGNVAAYSVPVPSVVTIRGVETNAGQPITYAVKFPERDQTIFNVVTTGNSNQYQLVPRF
ncbi:hypothetical protein [Bacillus sp. B15-48]|uniref:hypothetical protein n=1 Tax=Bacillus sp. B15-48 TaxID=1548601 RepID=UPI00193EEA37|nr:hypothetical protein [Bacillus sp. B15-48]MBM4764859.1 hypothetical protein [Bacillus sp. B15-48]